MMQPQTAPTPYLRPNQIEEFKAEVARIEEIEQGPAFIRNQVSDPREMRRYKLDLQKKLETETPQPLGGAELDAALRREAELRDRILRGMPTQAEMRRNPPGAVDKHREWERRNKPAVMEWKNLRLRLGMSGAIEDCPPDSSDVASVERLRPRGGGTELNLDVAQIAGREFHMPEKPESVVLTDQEIEAVRQVNPALADKLVFMSPDGRRRVKDAVAGLAQPPAPPEAAAEPEKPGDPPVISRETLEAIGYLKAKKLAGHFKVSGFGPISKEDLFALLLKTRSGWPMPEEFLA